MFRALFGMMSLRDWGLWSLLLIGLVGFGLARAQDDGIPDNCANPDGAYYRQKLFPRYEPQNRRLVLVNWNTGADEIVLSTNLDDTRILDWSVDCRYLATAVGPVESMATVVWDVVDNVRMGDVPDAHLKPHHVTWGPGDYLVVETRTGAILWDVPHNTQTPLTTSWNDTTTRNFSRLRWDATNQQLIVNLAVGGRAIYDLTTGQEVPQAINVTDSIPGDGHTSVVIGGKAYQCQKDDYRYGYRSWYSQPGTTVPGVFANYDALNKTITLELYDQPRPYEVIAMLEDDIAVSYFQFRGWSANCRYIVASLGRVGENASDTVAWDVVERQRVGTFEDARAIMHPLYWSKSDDAVVIETRDGAYLWYLPTDTRTLISDETRTSLDDRSGIDNFEDIVWNDEQGQVLITPLNSADWIAFDVRTGQSVTPILPAEMPASSSSQRLDADNQALAAPTPVEGVSGWGSRSYYYYWARDRKCDAFTLREDENTRQTSVVSNQTGETISVLQGRGAPYSFSPDCHYVYGYETFLSGENLPYDDRPLDDTYREAYSNIVVIWDAQTGARVLELPNPYRPYTYSRVDWSPGSDRAIIRTTEGFFLWYPASNQLNLLTFRDNRSAIETYFTTYWDYERGQVLVSGWDAVFAFNMQTGMERYRFTASPGTYYSCGYYGCNFSLADDNRTLFVGGFSSVGVWNLDTLEHAQVPVNWETAYLSDRIALSPDGRYLVIARNMLRVWDLLNLPDDFKDREPTSYQGPWSRVSSVQFIDNVTIETTDSEGIQRWNVETGTQITTE